MRDNAAYMPDEDQPDFSTITLEENRVEKKKKIPRRILHFSDGVLEEYSTDEEDENEKVANLQPVVDPTTLTWGPWLWNRVATGSTKTLAAVDYCGEKLARMFGILDSRYQYAIDEYHKQQREEEEEFRRDEQYAMRAVQSQQMEKVDITDSGEPGVQVVSSGFIEKPSTITPPVKVDPLPVNEQI